MDRERACRLSGEGQVVTSEKCPASSVDINIRRLVRREGAKGISGLIYEDTRGVLEVFLENMIRDAVCMHAEAQTSCTAQAELTASCRSPCSRVPTPRENI